MTTQSHNQRVRHTGSERDWLLRSSMAPAADSTPMNEARFTAQLRKAWHSHDLL